MAQIIEKFRRVEMDERPAYPPDKRGDGAFETFGGVHGSGLPFDCLRAILPSCRLPRNGFLGPASTTGALASRTSTRAGCSSTDAQDKVSYVQLRSNLSASCAQSWLNRLRGPGASARQSAWPRHQGMVTVLLRGWSANLDGVVGHSGLSGSGAHSTERGRGLMALDPVAPEPIQSTT
jgi:hypothetical protein